jgi:CheY-like chemotaxis protein
VPFERLDAVRRGIEGVGLGLVLARDLVRHLGGVLRVASTPGAGSTFSVELETTQPAAVDRGPRLMSDMKPRSYLEPKRVLYVEDIAMNIRLVEDMLRQRPNVELVPSTLGEAALSLATEHRPDLVLLDLHLPDIGGAEVLARLKAHDATRDIPVVILTADATGRHTDEILDAGAVAFLTKPVAIRELLRTLDSILGD